MKFSKKIAQFLGIRTIKIAISKDETFSKKINLFQVKYYYVQKVISK